MMWIFIAVIVLLVLLILIVVMHEKLVKMKTKV